MEMLSLGSVDVSPRHADGPRIDVWGGLIAGEYIGKTRSAVYSAMLSIWLFSITIRFHVPRPISLNMFFSKLFSASALLALAGVARGQQTGASYVDPITGFTFWRYVSACIATRMKTYEKANNGSKSGKRKLYLWPGVPRGRHHRLHWAVLCLGHGGMGRLFSGRHK